MSDLKIDFDELEKELFSQTDYVKPNYQGVYAICAKTTYDDFKYGKEKILYVGSSKNIAQRILAPIHPYRRLYSKLINHIVYTRSCKTENYLDFEIYMIKKHRPILNKRHK